MMQASQIVNRSKTLIRKGEIDLLFDELGLWLENQNRAKNDISFFSTTFDNLILLSSRYKGVINDRIQGVEETRLIEIQKAKICKNLLDIVNSIESFSKNGKITQSNDKKPTTSSSKKVEISLSFNRDFDSFSMTDQEWILKAITSLLNMEEGEIRINKFERGSVIITFELEETKAIELVELADAGILDFLAFESLASFKQENKVSVFDNTLNNSQVIEEQSWLTVFLWWCSGAVVFALKRFPTEKGKYIGIGTSILATSVFATISSIFAFNTFIDNVFVVIIISLLYGGMIFNLDRFIVSSIQPENPSDKRFPIILKAIPRLALGVILAITIAAPFQLKIFEPEINQELSISAKKFTEEKYKEDLDKKNELIAQINEETTDADSILEKARQDFLAEARGTDGTGKLGNGPAVKALEANYERLLGENRILKSTNDSLILIAKSDIDLIQNQYETELKTLDSTWKDTGLLGRIAAKESLLEKPENIALRWMNMLLLLLFIMIFTAPILIKILSRKGPYEVFLNELEKEEIKEIRKWKVKIGSKSSKQIT